ncbi:MAG: 1-deoxy-D-xylulose-5-phosphate reductoisomerase [Variibacter sp.]|nr:1-deoxy-D-xylulose-5-phosphate reductoisomerase [Variibacter sp.]
MQVGVPRAHAPPVHASAPKRVSILGATGSVGASTVDLIKRNRDKYEVEALAANSNAKMLAELARELGARFVAIADESRYAELKEALAGTHIEAAAGPGAIVEAALRPAEWVMAAISGAGGLEATMAALETGRTVALANKECLVCAGDLFMRRAAVVSARVLPVDSEHNAVFQAMAAGHPDDVERVVITASGGPFRTFTREQLRGVTREQALRHPNWSMGAKITIDSATMMNKGLELIEAHHLFGLPPDQIEAVVHPQSVVHGLVEFRDGSVIAALASPDMRVPIAHCLAWPERLDGPVPRLRLADIGTLTFSAPDLDLFPCLGLAQRALATGNGATTVLNAANEIAVAAFLQDGISFLGIAALVEAAMEAAERSGLVRRPSNLEDALALDNASRALARDLLPEIAAKRA